MTVHEQRKSRRFELRLPLELLRNGSAELLESGQTRNLSSSGVLFSSGARLEPGDVVEYVITLPASPKNLEVRLRCKGKVIRRNPGLANAREAAATLEKWEFIREHGPQPI